MMEKLPTHEEYSQDGHRGYLGAADATASISKSTRRDRLFRHIVIAIIGLCFAVYLFVGRSSIHGINIFSCHRSASKILDGSFGSTGKNRPHGVSSTLSPNKVPFEAHVMSKCPDARDCLQQLVLPAMEQIHDMVDFELSFIATVSNKSDDVECMHGPAECIGDILILCASNISFDDGSHDSTPHRTPIIRSLGYANCLISDYTDIPQRELVQGCALEHGIDFEAVNRCASGGTDDTYVAEGKELNGITLLQESALHSKEVGVSTSCTVRLDETVWCVRDGGEWKNCAQDGKGSDVSALVDEVKRLYKERN